jgi:paraquat-inducible protein A
MMTGGKGEFSALVACPSCDHVYDVSRLADGETARCSRCGHFLTTRTDDELERMLIFSVSALIAMVVACSFPFMSFSQSGLESTMTLPQTALSLWENDRPFLALMVGAFILLIPAALLFLIAILTIVLMLELRMTWVDELGRLIFSLQNWSMVEVFLVGVVVSLVKIAKMATVVMGVSFWSYVAFAILFTLTLTHIDRAQCWRRIEALTIR